MYVGAELSNINNVFGQYGWAVSSDKYCKAAVNNLESVLEKRDLRLPLKCVTPLTFVYLPEINVTGEIKAE